MIKLKDVRRTNKIFSQCQPKIKDVHEYMVIHNWTWFDGVPGTERIENSLKELLETNLHWYDDKENDDHYCSTGGFLVFVNSSKREVSVVFGRRTIFIEKPDSLKSLIESKSNNLIILCKNFKYE